MSKSGPEFFDDETVFRTYVNHRVKADTPNETIEQPIMWDLIGDVEGLDVLDLGCGDAQVAKRFRENGARSYTGVEGSRRMVEIAQANLEPGFSKVQHGLIEKFETPPESFDLIVSSLALHYIDDLAAQFARVHSALAMGGRFIFSVEHPAITSCNKTLESSPIRGSWIIDDYFNRGPRTVEWMGGTVTKYHRTIEDFFDLLVKSEFALMAFRECEPPRSEFSDEELYQRRMRIPLFLIFEAKKY